MKVNIPREFLEITFYGPERQYYYFRDCRNPLVKNSIIWRLGNANYSDGRLLEDWFREDPDLIRWGEKFNEERYIYPEQLEIIGKWEEIYKNGATIQAADHDIFELITILIKHNEWLKNKWMKGISKGEQAKLVKYDLHGVNLCHANLSKANLQEINLQDAQLQGVKFSEANLEGANLQNANLEKATFDGANLKDVNLVGANLSGAKLNNANLEKTDFKNAVLNHSVFLKAQFKNTNISVGALGNAVMDVHSRNIVNKETNKNTSIQKFDDNQNTQEKEFLRLVEKMILGISVYSNEDLDTFIKLMDYYAFDRSNRIDYEVIRDQLVSEIEKMNSDFDLCDEYDDHDNDDYDFSSNY